MGTIYADDEVSGIQHFQEHLYELISDTRYEMSGPTATYDREDWRDMDEEDRQHELDQWEPPSDERATELRVRLDTLNEVWNLADKTIGGLYKRAASRRQEYNRGKHGSGVAYMSQGEEMWRMQKGRR